MKDKIHPTLHKVVFIDQMSNDEFVATSTLTSAETKKINGVEHYIIRVETSSATHPVYTGKKRHELKNDQVAKYLAKVAKAQAKNKPKIRAEKTDDNKAKTSTTKKTVKKAKTTKK